jgi:hypothetical protein
MVYFSEGRMKPPDQSSGITRAHMAHPTKSGFWEAGNCIGTDSCTVTIDKVKTVQATFVGDFKLKVVNKSRRGGTGLVSSTPSGISCSTGSSTGCEEPYGYGEEVTLSASADSGSTFLGWSPAKLCPGTGDCIVLMDKKRTIKAVFSGQ